MSPQSVDLPAGVEHGTPEGHTAGCNSETKCPALFTHGMACLFAKIRAESDPRYYRAKARDPRPAAIARTLGFVPLHLRENAAGPTPKLAPTLKLAPATIPTPTPPPAPAAAGKPKRKSPTGPRQSEVRAWALANGIEVNKLGTIRREVVDAFLAAQGISDEPDVATPVATSTEPPTENSGELYVDPDLVPIVVANEKFAEQLDEIRERIDMPRADRGRASTDPSWGEITISEDVEAARGLAVRLEQELAATAAQLLEARNAVDVTLIRWGSATAQVSALQRELTDLKGILADTNTYIEEQRKEREGLRRNVLRLAENTTVLIRRIKQQDRELSELRSRRWWNIGRRS